MHIPSHCSGCPDASGKVKEGSLHILEFVAYDCKRDLRDTYARFTVIGRRVVNFFGLSSTSLTSQPLSDASSREVRAWVRDGRIPHGRACESDRAVPVRAGARKTPKQMVTGSPAPPMNLAPVHLDRSQSESPAAALRGQLLERAAAQTPASYASASPDPGEPASYASASPDPGESTRDKGGPFRVHRRSPCSLYTGNEATPRSRPRSPLSPRVLHRSSSPVPQDGSKEAQDDESGIDVELIVTDGADWGCSDGENSSTKPQPSSMAAPSVVAFSFGDSDFDAASESLSVRDVQLEDVNEPQALRAGAPERVEIAMSSSPAPRFAGAAFTPRGEQSPAASSPQGVGHQWGDPSRPTAVNQHHGSPSSPHGAQLSPNDPGQTRQRSMSAAPPSRITDFDGRSGLPPEVLQQPRLLVNLMKEHEDRPELFVQCCIWFQLQVQNVKTRIIRICAHTHTCTTGCITQDRNHMLTSRIAWAGCHGGSGEGGRDGGAPC